MSYSVWNVKTTLIGGGRGGGDINNLIAASFHGIKSCISFLNSSLPKFPFYKLYLSSPTLIIINFATVKCGKDSKGISLKRSVRDFFRTFSANFGTNF